jgi:glyoxylase-like metal-dependent hydrolase (beta-lactamase superfamily II)
MPSPVPYTGGLHAVAPDTYAYLQPPGSWGQSNGGLVVAGEQAVLVDTPWTLQLTRDLLALVEHTVPGTRITTVVNSHPNGDHCWGNQLFDGCEIVASKATADAMCDEIGPDAMMAMMNDLSEDSALGAYMRRFFSGYDFTGIEITPPTRTFTGEITIHIGGRAVDLIEVGPAHTVGDVIVHVPDAGVVYAGDILFVGDHPVMWTGPVEGWVAACDRIVGLQPRVVVPGHGPVTDVNGVAAVRDYLVEVRDHAVRYHAAGTPYDLAAARIAAGCRRRWGHPERLVITVGTIYRNLGWEDPDGRAGMIAKMAQLRRDLDRHGLSRGSDIATV